MLQTERFYLTNGLPVCVLPSPHLHSLRLDYFLRDGSRWETRVTGGLAHFTEHMLFGGNRVIANKREMALALAAIGGATNGETGPEAAGFYLGTRPAHLARAMELFGAMITGPLFQPVDIQMEKRIVLAEIGEELRKGSVDELLWPDHPLSYYVSGRPENVRRFDSATLADHHRRFYTPDNGVLVVTGPVTGREVRPLAEAHFAQLTGSFAEPALPAAGLPLSPTVVRFATVADMPSHTLYLAFPVGRPDFRQQAALYLLNTILGASDTSRLFQSLRETLGLVYTVESALTLWADTGALYVELNVSSRHLHRALGQALQEIKRLAGEEVPRAELERAKEWQVANLEGVLDDPAGIARRLALQELFQDLPPVDEAIRLTQSVEPIEIQQVARDVLLPGAARLFVQGPGLDREDQSEIRAVLRQYARGT
ncbi:MAG: M16 family metallopeptidase [Symbiobacteriia bacterium]